MTAYSKFTADTRAAAASYLEQGFIPVPIPRTGGCKRPVLTAWQELRPTLADLDNLFDSHEPLNIGLLLGAPSLGLIDIDLDVPEAIAAAQLLPPTGWISGRESKPRSHWWYLVDNPPDKASDEFRDLDGQTVLLEVRSTRGETVSPPSVHESGESVFWDIHEQPARIVLPDLIKAVGAVAAVALLGRHWPLKSSRQTAFLALAGALLRGGWAEDRAAQFIGTLAFVTKDEEARKRVQTIGQTARKLEREGKATGWPKLEELLGKSGRDVVTRVRNWLGMVTAKEAEKATVRTLEPFAPFPAEVLPEPIRGYVVEGAKAIGCDASYLALPTLAAVSAIIGNRRSVRLKRGWEEPCVIWTAIVGDSGSLKSPACQKSVGYLFRLQKRLLDEHREA